MISFRKETHSTLQTASRKLHCLLSTLRWHWSIYYFKVILLIEIKQSSHDFPAPTNTFPPISPARLEASHPSGLQCGAREHQVLLPGQQLGSRLCPRDLHSLHPRLGERSPSRTTSHRSEIGRCSYSIGFVHLVQSQYTKRMVAITEREPQNQLLRWLFNFRFMVIPEPLCDT